MIDIDIEFFSQECIFNDGVGSRLINEVMVKVNKTLKTMHDKYFDIAFTSRNYH